jgi:hypothetical protein
MAPPKKPQVTGRAVAPVISNPTFKALVIINCTLCFLTLAVMVWAAASSDDPMSKGKERLFTACEHVFTLTAGAFIGLLGGKAASPTTATATTR